MVALGMDGMAFLEETDEIRRNIIMKVCEQAFRSHNVLMENLAIQIVNQLGKGIKFK